MILKKNKNVDPKSVPNYAHMGTDCRFFIPLRFTSDKWLLVSRFISKMHIYCTMDYGHPMKAYIKEIWKFGRIWQTKYASAVPKNLGVGVDFSAMQWRQFLHQTSAVRVLFEQETHNKDVFLYCLDGQWLIYWFDTLKDCQKLLSSL